MHRRTVPTSLAAAAVVAVLAGCAAGGNGSGGAEGSSDPVTFICTPQEDWCQLVASEFTSATGIRADYVRLSGGEAVARLSATGDSPEFDAWFGGGAEGHLAADEAGFIEPYTSPNAERIADEYKDPDGRWTGVYVGALSFCSNTDVLDEIGAKAPTSWQDLLDPKFKANVAMAHPGTSGTAYQALWTEVDLNDGDQDAALAYFTKLHSNILQYSKSGSAPGQMAGRGEVATGVIFAQDCQKFINEGFTNLTTTFPKEGTGYEVGAVSLLANARNPEGAKAFIDWTLTAEAQDLAATVGSYSVPTNPDATLTDDMVDLDEVTLEPVDLDDAGAARTELVARFDTEVAPAPKE
ncbi:ABC transporter substrate-binding protein [Frigoribacterium sp. PhB24]|uniref:ABC transporter substrate-binding protein n=1 Tax=Frigoribacterium sp. PhB24 TaxID=2485204 RepID=UPI000F472938|nr:ABC transporter substrate-binding protein [Frigoribacterium sp. PhB24]ROS50246.1 iron(III) transport system substrate-binding protein [Frigoribacterium sp. PhB24]